MRAASSEPFFIGAFAWFSWCCKTGLRASAVLSTRANGFKKQTEILRQKHQEFLEKYKIRSDGKEK